MGARTARMCGAQAWRGSTGLLAGVVAVVCLPDLAWAQDISLSFGDDTSLATRSAQFLLLITALAFLPGAIMAITSFPFFLTVFAILRQGIGLQTSPPNMLIVALALFLTFYVMEPVMFASWEQGLRPFFGEEIGLLDALPLAFLPFAEFMETRVDPDTFETLQSLRPLEPDSGTRGWSTYTTLVPAFLLSEIERAFQVGFFIFLPFLIIDLVVSAILMSMGMMMIPPAIVSLPFKLAFFVVADGWRLIAEALVLSYQ